MSIMIINPGSEIGEPGAGWTNTEAKARSKAERWLTTMHAEGMTGVVLLEGSEERAGRWLFTFRHEITGATATLETHGIDDLGAYRKAHLFPPRAYWNGSSCAEPKLEDFAAPGFVAVRTFAAATAEGGEHG